MYEKWSLPCALFFSVQEAFDPGWETSLMLPLTAHQSVRQWDEDYCTLSIAVPMWSLYTRCKIMCGVPWSLQWWGPEDTLSGKHGCNTSSAASVCSAVLSWFEHQPAQTHPSLGWG